MNPPRPVRENPNAEPEHLQALCHLKNQWICRSAWGWHRVRDLADRKGEEDAGCAGKNFRIGEMMRAKGRREVLPSISLRARLSPVPE